MDTIKQARESKDERIQSMTDDLDTQNYLNQLAESYAGKMIISAHIKDIVNSVDKLCIKYETFTLTEFVSTCATMKSKLDMVRLLTQSKGKVDLVRKDIEEALTL